MFISVTSPVVLCMYNFVLNLFYLLLISFLQTRVAAYSIKRVCTSGWFAFPVGLCELMANNKCSHNTNKRFKVVNI